MHISEQLAELKPSLIGPIGPPGILNTEKLKTCFRIILMLIIQIIGLPGSPGIGRPGIKGKASHASRNFCCLKNELVQLIWLNVNSFDNKSKNFEK